MGTFWEPISAFTTNQEIMKDTFFTELNKIYDNSWQLSDATRFFQTVNYHKFNHLLYYARGMIHVLRAQVCFKEIHHAEHLDKASGMS